MTCIVVHKLWMQILKTDTATVNIGVLQYVRSYGTCLAMAKCTVRVRAQKHRSTSEKID